MLHQPQIGLHAPKAVACGDLEGQGLLFLEVEHEEVFAVTTFGLVDLDVPVDTLAGRLAAVRIFAGYAGWGAGQLEDEIDEGAWYVVPAEAGDLCREDAVDLAREVLRRQPGELAWHSTRPADPDLN